MDPRENVEENLTAFHVFDGISLEIIFKSDAGLSAAILPSLCICCIVAETDAVPEEEDEAVAALGLVPLLFCCSIKLSAKAVGMEA